MLLFEAEALGRIKRDIVATLLENSVIEIEWVGGSEWLWEELPPF